MATSPHQIAAVPSGIIDEEQRHNDSRKERPRFSFMEWLERRSQPYIVGSMAIVAVLRGFYLFTDKLVNLAHYTALNATLSLVTGVLLSCASELTITIAGRRHKLFKVQLFNAKLALASATLKQKPIWEVEVERLADQVKANAWAMRISMGMSLLAAASYLIDSTGAVGFIGFAIASALAAYVLYLMYYHGVQTDEIVEDGTAETADAIREELNLIRIEEIARLRSTLASAAVSPTGRLALIASGLPIPDQRQVMPILRLMLRAESPEEEADPTATWLAMRDVALRAGEDLINRTVDDVTRKYRRKCASQARRYPDLIQLHPVRGWIVEPTFVEGFFDLSSLGESGQESGKPRPQPGAIVEAERAHEQVR